MKCSQCGAEFQGKFCPECGAKMENEVPLTSSHIPEEVNSSQQTPPVFNAKLAGKKRTRKPRKPFYKRWWFILIVIILALGVVASLTGNEKEKKRDKIDWSTIILKDVIPEPPSKQGTLFENSDEELRVGLDKVTDDQYNTYLNACVDRGFTVDAEKSSYSYEAYNTDGYSLEIRHISDDLDITLKAPMEMSTISWPTGIAGSLIPAPKSTTGKFIYEHDTNFSVYVGDTSKTDYDEYVTACSDKGFNVDYDKDEKNYRAYNADGYCLSLSYEGNNIMLVSVDEPDEKASDDTKAITETESAIETETESATETEASSSTESPENSGTSESVDGIRPEFKEAMDSYEAFYDDYCDFMIKYKANPTDMKLIAEYSDMMKKLTDMDEKFNAWEGNDLSAEELKYYLDVHSRITQKILDAAS